MTETFAMRQLLRFALAKCIPVLQIAFKRAI